MGFQNRIEPKRSLGQNFFINDNLVRKIIDEVLKSLPEHITEVGAGKGAFTKVFYETTVGLTVIEKDFVLAQFLQNNFKEAETYNIDFLDFPLQDKNTTYFGSLPFNVADEIIKKILISDTFKNPAFFIIQKEVAEKYLNRKKNPLGLIREVYADFEIIMDIKPGNFLPRPKVTSSFVKFIPHNRYQDIDKNALEGLIVRSFGMPRKTIKNNLKPYSYKIPESLLLKRGAELSIEDFVSILEFS